MDMMNVLIIVLVPINVLQTCMSILLCVRHCLFLECISISNIL